MEKDYGLSVTEALLLPDEVNTDTALNSLQVLKHFAVAVNNGIQPDERVMKEIAKVFALYFCQPRIVGNPEKFKSLDECFNLKPKQGIGHPVKHLVNSSIRMIFLNH